MKYLLLFAFVGIIWWLWRKRRDAADERPPPVSSPTENMVTCAHCRVHLPESDALRDGDRHYCNAAHRDAARGKGA